MLGEQQQRITGKLEQKPRNSYRRCGGNDFNSNIDGSSSEGFVGVFLFSTSNDNFHSV